MRVNAVHRVRYSKGLLLLTALVPLVAARPAVPDPECVVAARWVANHSLALPSTAAAFGLYSNTYKVAIYNALPAETRAAVWSEHYKLVLQTPNLTATQRTLIEQRLENVQWLHTSGVSLSQRQAETREFATKARLHFDRHQASIIFTVNGFGRESELLFGGSGIFAAKTALLPPVCTCNVGDPGCECVAAPHGECAPTEQGCGWDGMSSCNGRCVG